MIFFMDDSGGSGGPTDPYFANVVSLLHFDGADASTTFTDQTGRVWTPSGGAKISTARSKFGGASGLFNGSTSSVINAASDASLGFGSGDLCFEAWLFFDSPYVTPRLMGNLAGSGWAANRWVVGNISNGVQFYANNFSAGSPLLSSTVTGLSGWKHIAIARSGSTWRLFIDGVLDTSGTFAGSLDGGGSQTFHMGGSGGSAEFYNGSIDDARITNGVARYTAAFTPPAAPFPNS